MDNQDIASSRIILHNSIFNQIISKENLLISWQEFKLGKKNKKDVMEFDHNLAENLFSLHYDLTNKTYRHGYYTSFYIHDPKLRHIHKASVKDRVLHHAIMRIIEPIFDKTFIFDSYSSRKDKGTHRAILRLKNFAWQLSKNNTKIVWALKCDIRKFFNSIDQQILFNLIEKKISDPDLLALLKDVIESYPMSLNLRRKSRERPSTVLSKGKGAPLGNLTSQLFSNIYLDPLDQFIKRRLKKKHYVRYADDFAILSCDQSHLKKLIPIIRNFLNKKLKLKLHPEKIIIRKWSQGIDFLGFVVFPHYVVLRTKTKRRMMRKISENCRLLHDREITKEKFGRSLQSYLGLLRHCRSHAIIKNINDRIII